MFWAMPLSAEPIRKSTIEVMKTPLRPYMSPSLPQIGVEAAVARVYAGDHPRQVLEAAELADDRRHRGAHDHVVEHREHHRDHEREQHDPHAPGLFLRLGPSAPSAVSAIVPTPLVAYCPAPATYLPPG